MTKQQRKTDKYRLIENRGIGRKINYKSWLRTHEFSSIGRATRILGWKIRRMYYLFSDLELYFFLITQWEDDVIDIREQYPLIPVEQTSIIANQLGIRHPQIINKLGEKQDVFMTTDFVITKKKIIIFMILQEMLRCPKILLKEEYIRNLKL